MAKYRKLGRTSSQRKALLRSQVTALIENGKIVTTEARAKEVRKQAEKLITLAVKEKDNYETVTVSAKVAKKDADGKRVKEVVDGKLNKKVISSKLVHTCLNITAVSRCKDYYRYISKMLYLLSPP